MHASIPKKLLQEYLDAERALKRAESRLDKRIEPEVARLIRERDTDGIQHYIDVLPRKAKAVRRLYEAWKGSQRAKERTHAGQGAEEGAYPFREDLTTERNV